VAAPCFSIGPFARTGRPQRPPLSTLDRTSGNDMNIRLSWKRTAQFVVVLFCAVAVKFYYSTASVNHLRWILAPTTFLVELISGSQFEFEPYAGYMNRDRSFVIAASCAGVNFLITAFLMLAIRRLWADRTQNRPVSSGWKFIPAAALIAYATTLVANTVRISTALQLRGSALGMGWLDGSQLHRFEGIFVYFGFLLLLFLVSEKVSSPAGARAQESSTSKSAWALLRQSAFPLLIYYATTLGIPLANGAYRTGPATGGFWEHAVFVLVTPLVLILPLTAFRLSRKTAFPIQNQQPTFSLHRSWRAH